jgi:hypothetical protein
MKPARMPDGSEVMMPDTDCLECPYPDRCDGKGCAEGSGGAGCAYCDDGANGTTQHYQSGSACKPCPETQGSNVILVVISIAVGAALCAYVWKVSTVTIPAENKDGGDAATERGTTTDAVEEINTNDDVRTGTEETEDDEGKKAASQRKKEAKEKAKKLAASAGVVKAASVTPAESVPEPVPETEAVAETSRSAVATMSNSAIVAGIALPSIFKITFTFNLPSIGMPKVLTVIGSWILQVVSVDLQFANPECAMENPDALTVFKMQFYLVHIIFFLILMALSLPAVCGKGLHATNARIAAYTLAVGALVKSCVRCLACQEEVLGYYVNDGSARVVMMALPDELCWTTEHNSLAIFAATGLIFYVVIVPVVLYCKAKRAAADGVWTEEELQECGWLVLKYKPSRWYFEFVLLIDKIIFVALGVFFASDRSVNLLLGFSIVFTLAVLTFVACDKPYRREDTDNDDGSMGEQDKKMAVSLGLQLVSFMLAWIVHGNRISRKDYQPNFEDGEEPLEGLSPVVEFLAVVVGLGVMVIQIGMIWRAGREKEVPEDNTTPAAAGDGDGNDGARAAEVEP